MLMKKGGMRVDVTLDDSIHDRFLILDNGCVFKLGRGLDIFKPVAGPRDSGSGFTAGASVRDRCFQTRDSLTGWQER